MTPQSPPGLAAASILIVEDRPDTRSLLRLALESAGHHVAEAGNLAGAREALRRDPAELVLCGIQLGAGESGLDLLRELTPGSPDIAVVMLTGDRDTQTAIDCLRDGAFDYLLKGFRAEELSEVIERTLRRRRWMISERQRVTDPIGILSRFASENPNPVLRVAHNGVILYANAACQRIFGESNCRVGEKVPRFLSPSPREARVGRGTGREAFNKSGLLSPALASCGEERENIGSGQAMVEDAAAGSEKRRLCS